MYRVVNPLTPSELDYVGMIGECIYTSPEYSRTGNYDRLTLLFENGDKVTFFRYQLDRLKVIYIQKKEFGDLNHIALDAEKTLCGLPVTSLEMGPAIGYWSPTPSGNYCTHCHIDASHIRTK